MPRVFLLDDDDPARDAEDLDDADFDPFLAAPSQFQYLPAPALGGPEGAVRVPVTPQAAAAAAAAAAAKPRFRWPWEAKRSRIDAWAQQREQGARQAEALAAQVAAGLQGLGVRRVYCRYDGGNDEGFAWFVHGEMTDGALRDGDQLAADLAAANFPLAAQVAKRPYFDALEEVAITWACALLGQGYGTGEFVMYGAFWVDLETGRVTDDPDPAPVTKNLRIKPE